MVKPGLQPCHGQYHIQDEEVLLHTTMEFIIEYLKGKDPLLMLMVCYICLTKGVQ